MSKYKIVTVPHPALRQSAKPITTYDKKIQQFLTGLADALVTGPAFGVGLSAPQVDKQWRAYVTRRNVIDESAPRTEVEFFLNPRIVKTSRQHGLGKDHDGTPLEGCLSIPGLFGPVPRYAWIEVEFERPDDNGQLQSDRVRLEGFPARLAQHEIDHLDGILFTDYTQQYKLPLYVEDDQKELVLVSDSRFIESY